MLFAANFPEFLSKIKKDIKTYHGTINSEELKNILIIPRRYYFAMNWLF